MADRHPIFRRILVVCAGNICRSPIAEALLRARLANLGRATEIASAGIIAISGDRADELTSQVAALHGIDLSDHRARAFKPEMIRSSDLVLVMEQEQRREILGRLPLAAGKVFLLGHWAGTEIPDPYMEDWATHERTFTQIAEAVEAWLPRL